MTDPRPDHALAAFQYAPVGIIYAENRVIIDANICMGEMFGQSPETLRGMSLELLYPSREEFDRIGRNVPDQLRDGASYADERIMRRQSGELFWCQVRGQALDHDTPFSRTIWTFVDISNLRPIVPLTAREREVAEKVAQGKTAKEIARELDLSHRTIELYRSRLIQKLDAKNTLELVAKLTGFPF